MVRCDDAISSRPRTARAGARSWPRYLACLLRESEQQDTHRVQQSPCVARRPHQLRQVPRARFCTRTHMNASSVAGAPHLRLVHLHEAWLLDRGRGLLEVFARRLHRPAFVPQGLERRPRRAQRQRVPLHDPAAQHLAQECELLLIPIGRLLAVHPAVFPSRSACP